jgi:MSHA biogenesis protein MshJ
MNQLKQHWLTLSTRLDAMTLRERAMVFVAVTGSLLFLIYTIAVEPMLTRQTALRAEIMQQQNQIGGIDLEIAAKAQGFVVDPDAQAHAQLKQARAEVERISSGLLAVQKGLVAPDRIAPLLEHLLNGNGKLKLVSMKSLPVAGMNDAASAGAAPVATANAPAPSAAPAPAAAPATAPAAAVAPPPTAKPRELLYRHGVEIVVQGGYLDMIAYMQALEALPVQLFWGAARLDAQQYPDARLTLTLYTLSLDEKWMKL